jgi:hypothetical protein
MLESSAEHIRTTKANRLGNQFNGTPPRIRQPVPSRTQPLILDKFGRGTPDGSRETAVELPRTQANARCQRFDRQIMIEVGADPRESSTPRGALSAAGARRARLLEEALLLGQHAVQVIEMVKNPQGLDPSADLNRGRAMLHCPDRSHTDSKALREDGHGVVARETQRLQADPKLR